MLNDGIYKLTCLECEGMDFTEKRQQHLMTIAGDDVCMSGRCWECDFCGNSYMDSEQMNEFLVTYRKLRQKDRDSCKDIVI
jgi:hypothetical protein